MPGYIAALVNWQTVYLLGDAHLGGRTPPAVSQALHGFLERVPQDGEQVVINGDLFDFWFEYRTVIPRHAFPTLARLAELRRRGVRLTLTGGNHDRWGRRFWQRELGAEFHPQSAELSLGGWRVFLAHGDGLAEAHLAARLLHGVTRHPVTAGVFRWIHPDLAYRLVERFSGVLGEETKDPAVLERAAAAQAAWARALLQRRNDLDLVILGHTHRPALEAVAQRRWYVNPGAWMDGFHYATLTERGPELHGYQPGT